MELLIQGKFYNPTKGNLSFEESLEEMMGYIKEKPHASYEVIVGCDSSSSQEPTFPLVIVILRKREGGRFFLQRINYAENKKFYNLHDRILEEVLLSCQLAVVLRERFKERMESAMPEVEYELEYIHADVGLHGPTKDMIKEVTGLIRGNGFEPKIKPESFAASNVADRFS
ncbi:MAG: ribonuclease H-like YkuK family protein [bacterium]|nr:ribonuclease H-like YkuK family protein [bacterium]